MHDEQLRHPEHETLTNVAGVGVVAENTTQTDCWSAGQPTSNELKVTHASIEAAIDAFEATLAPKVSEPVPSVIDEISNMAPKAASAEIPEIRGQHRDGNWISVAQDVADNSAVGYLQVHLSEHSTLGGLADRTRKVFDVSAAFNSLAQKLNSSGRLLGSEKKTATRIESPGGSTAYKPSPDAPNVGKASVSAAIAPDSAYRPSPSAARLSATSLPPISPITQEKIGLPGPAAAQRDESVLPRLTRTPDTRPATIEGWIVRQVYGGTAVLEGPGGVWRATRGDTVPGVGRFDWIVLWGGPWIVATTEGLITTQ